ncbi:uncharacterized protein LOC110682604 [Chenopodium quinoa]|uniref:uncharacterized protein LOC110682604 n=1 Tax=Chenopodium quinoa TaxID=63459 RepID=UPI000B76D58B|nr:uncharacterized protein LOC110682604 [Chenopodium quinoa]
MALFRALSTRRSRREGYDRLLDETNTTGVHDYSCAGTGGGGAGHAVLKRVTSVPASMLFGSSSKKLDFETGHLGKNSKPKQQQPAKSKKSGKSHPVFSLFDGKWRKKKMTANPDFSRYIEYLKEGGVWNKDTNSPAIYYK